MPRKGRPFGWLTAIIPCCVVIGVSFMCVVFVPEDVRNEFEDVFITYEVTQEGNILWKERVSSRIRLVVESNLRASGTEHSLPATHKLECNESMAYIHELALSPTSVQCFEVYSARGGLQGCSEDASLGVEDCILMQIPDQAPSDGEVYWYGGSELYLQQWPLNNVTKEMFNIFLSSDLPWRHGNVLERYWLSSSGVAIYVHSEVPLFVEMTKNEKICLQANYNATHFLGAAYSPGRNVTKEDIKTELRYSVCFGNGALAMHDGMLKKANEESIGFIDRPTEMPDLRMLKDPIWSTWARYKSSVNQSVIEALAGEILDNNFTSSQLEIDDGYESNYGDFTFSPDKFPNATRMIMSLHDKGFRVTTWVTPFINTGSANYIEGRRKGYFVRKSTTDSNPDLVTWWNGIGALVDFTNPEAASWYENLLENAKSSYGLDSFKFDAGETNYLPRNVYTMNYMENPGEFTHLYTQSAYKIGGKMMEMRSAWKTQSWPIFMRMMDKGSRWGGFKGLVTLIPTALIFGIIGYPYVLPDMIGGNAYGNQLPDKELFVRWLEVAAFMPVMQFSITPWDYDEEVTEIAQYYTIIHRTVVYDEIVRTAKDYASGKGTFLPVSPVWFLANSSESEAYSCSDQFLVGQRYLVAPILWEGVRKRDIYLPGGPDRDQPIMWRDMLKDSDKIVTGGQWIMGYPVQLSQISWWERLNVN